MQLTPSPLDDPALANFAWARDKRLMRFIALLTLAVVIVSWTVLYRQVGFLSVPF